MAIHHRGKSSNSWSRSLPTDYADFLPPFQGGIAGLIGFDASSWLETVPRARIDDFSTPAMSVGLYDWTIATDHRQNISWIVSQGLGVADQKDRLRVANERADQVESWLARRRHRPIRLRQCRALGATKYSQAPNSEALYSEALYSEALCGDRARQRLEQLHKRPIPVLRSRYHRPYPPW